jgi:hypothetical protein
MKRLAKALSNGCRRRGWTFDLNRDRKVPGLNSHAVVNRSEDEVIANSNPVDRDIDQVSRHEVSELERCSLVFNGVR